MRPITYLKHDYTSELMAIMGWGQLHSKFACLPWGDSYTRCAGRAAEVYEVSMMALRVQSPQLIIL